MTTPPVLCFVEVHRLSLAPRTLQLSPYYHSYLYHNKQLLEEQPDVPSDLVCRYRPRPQPYHVMLHQHIFSGLRNCIPADRGKKDFTSSPGPQRVRRNLWQPNPEFLEKPQTFEQRNRREEICEEEPCGGTRATSRRPVMHLLVAVFLASLVSVDAAAPRTFLWQEVGNPSCVRCCEASEEPAGPPKKSKVKEYVVYPMPRVQPRIEMSILKGLWRTDQGPQVVPLSQSDFSLQMDHSCRLPDQYSQARYKNISVPAMYTQSTRTHQSSGDKGEMGGKGPPGVSGKEGERGFLGAQGMKGQKGQTGPPGNSCKIQYAAFSVARRKSLHSTEYFQTVVFDTEFVNLYEHFNMFSGTFVCYVPGIYFFNLNVHTWNLKETYLHIMKNTEETAILYAQPSDRSIMQSQSLMLELKEKDEVWVRMFKRERENALYNDESDVYLIFNGYLIKAMDD